MTEAWVVGAYRTDVITGKKTLMLPIKGGTLNASGECLQNSGADYAVTAGKTFYVTGILIFASTAVAHTTRLRYADNAALTTNPVDMGLQLPTAAIVITNLPYIPLAFLTGAPATKYVGFYNAAAVNHSLTGWVTGVEV
jgi:hypothetical protein